MENLVEIRGLSKRYEGFALDGVDLDVPAGYVVGLVGANGAGKTTIIKSLLGLVRPATGEVRLFGCPASAGGWEQRVGVVLDTCAFPGGAHVADIARVGRAAYPNWDDALFWDALATAGIDAKKAVKDLSRGMGMRLSLAFALAHKPDLLVLDEPTAGLDPLARGEALELLRGFMDEERGILIASHITTDLEKLADWIVCIDAGRVAFSLPKDDICGLAGIARCRQADFERLAESGLVEPGGLRYLRRAHGVDALVPNRFALERLGLGIACDAASIDEYLELVLKGDAR